MTHLWVRAEQRPNEERVGLTPEGAGDLIKASDEISNGEKSIGEVSVFVSKQQLNQQLAASTLSNLTTLTALIIVMAIVMTIVMNQVIIGPITRLAKHADDLCLINSMHTKAKLPWIVFILRLYTRCTKDE